jgi:hypothetical protein
MVRRILKVFMLFIAFTIFILLIILFSPPVYRRAVTYPAFEREVKDFQNQRKDNPVKTRLRLFRGIMHAHTYWSHDSRGTISDIVSAASIDGIDFILLTDHPHGNADTIPRGIAGYYKNVLIVPGSEKQGFDVWPSGKTIIDWSREKDSVARKIITENGIVCLAHTEEEHNWNSRWYQGMEIYNFHADTKDEMIVPQVANFIINGGKYPQWSLRQMFDEQSAILTRWDSLNTIRKIVGFAAEDTHENQNIRARYSRDGRVEWYGPDAKLIGITKASFWNRWLFHQPDQSGWIFRWMIDTYREGFNYVTNYVYADTLTTGAVFESIRKGHLFVAFKALGDAKGFTFTGEDQNDKICGIMGDSISFDKVKSLSSFSPLPGQFTLLHNGKIVNCSPYGSYQYKWEEMIEKGSYRIEVHIKIRDEDLPWIYSNPIYVY